jgi:DNA polymerase III epsilon subunit-like protein
MIISLDTETTGLLVPGKPAPAIVELGIYQYGDIPSNRIERSWRINPEIDDDRWEQKAIEVTGITPDQVRDLPSFFIAGMEIATLMVGTRALIGWNIEHDVSVLAHTLERYGMAHNYPWPPVHIDVMHIATDKCNIQGRNGRKFPTLSEAYFAIFGENLDGAHGALADARATAEVAAEICPTLLSRFQYDEL